MKEPLTSRQQQIRDFVREYGVQAAIDGTGLPLCDIRSTYTDTRAIDDHVLRVYEFYVGLAHEFTLSDTDDFDF